MYKVTVVQAYHFTHYNMEYVERERTIFTNEDKDWALSEAYTFVCRHSNIEEVILEED